ncbi:MAG: hypothetical protein H7Z74_14350 [Anaerolineae bacterium]|nr:hypothetical protein [Gemmatimonadaceae bacterium]
MSNVNLLHNRSGVRTSVITSILSLLGVAVTGCGGSGEQTAERPTPDSVAASETKALTVTAANFGSLRWLEGSWRGHGTEQAPFFEQYRFVDDSTLAVDSFEDSTFSNKTSTALVELRNGQLVNQGEGAGASWVVTALDSAEVTFGPLKGARNSYIWRRGPTPHAWTAIIVSRNAEGAQKERVYQMERAARK